MKFSFPKRCHYSKGFHDHPQWELRTPFWEGPALYFDVITLELILFYVSPVGHLFPVHIYVYIQ